MLASSLRHGITTETTSSSSAGSASATGGSWAGGAHGVERAPALEPRELTTSQDPGKSRDRRHRVADRCDAPSATLAAVRICLVYDCLFPYTVGGAERWYRNLAERLAADGHEVTYLTLRQWERSAPPEVPGVRVVAVGPRLGLYTRRAPTDPAAARLRRRRARAPRAPRTRLRRRAHRLVSLLLAARRGGRAAPGRLRAASSTGYEVWTREYWREYLGPVGGWIGWRCSARCAARAAARVLLLASCTRARLRGGGAARRGHGARRRCTPAPGAAPSRSRPSRASSSPAGTSRRSACRRSWRRCRAGPARARAARWMIFGDGPERRRVRRVIASSALGRASSTLPGFVTAEEVDAALARALCLVLPVAPRGLRARRGRGGRGGHSQRRGRRARQRGDRARRGRRERLRRAVRLAARTLADAIVRVREGGPALRASTARLVRAQRAPAVARRTSLDRVAAAYRA